MRQPRTASAVIRIRTQGRTASVPSGKNGSLSYSHRRGRDAIGRTVKVESGRQYLVRKLQRALDRLEAGLAAQGIQKRFDLEPG